MRNIFEKYAGEHFSVSDVHTVESTFHAEPAPKEPAQGTAQTEQKDQKDGEVRVWDEQHDGKGATMHDMLWHLT